MTFPRAIGTSVSLSGSRTSVAGEFLEYGSSERPWYCTASVLEAAAWSTPTPFSKRRIPYGTTRSGRGWRTGGRSYRSITPPPAVCSEWSRPPSWGLLTRLFAALRRGAAGRTPSEIRRLPSTSAIQTSRCRTRTSTARGPSDPDAPSAAAVWLVSETAPRTPSTRTTSTLPKRPAPRSFPTPRWSWSRHSRRAATGSAGGKSGASSPPQRGP